MCLKVAGTILVVAMLAVVLANQNDAGDGPAEAGDRTTQDAAVVAEDSGEPEPKPDSREEILRLRNSFNEMKGIVASRLVSLQGLGQSQVVIDGKAIVGEIVDGKFKDRQASGNSPTRLRSPMSREEEEWIVLAGELRSEDFVELLLNRIADHGYVHLLGRTPYQGYPAYYYLCKIGLPSCQPALHRIPLEPDDKIRDYLTRLLQRCLGNSEARSRLLVLKEKCETDETRERVQTAIEQCDAKPSPHQMNCR